MVRRLHSKFALDIFLDTSQISQLTKYLNVYLQNIAPENRTDTNELIEFLGDPFDDRKITYFGLSYDNQPCGFATVMFYPSDSVLIVDHMAIDGKVRGFGAFFAFVDLISAYLSDVALIPDYVVAEIMRRTQSVQGDVNPTQLIRLLRFIGFRVLQIPYVAPHSGIAKNAEQYKSALMIIPRQPLDELPADECRRIVELIYFNHYLKWYQRAMSRPQASAYRAALQACVKPILQKLSSSEFVKLNGTSVSSAEFPMRSDISTHAINFTYASLLLIPAALTIVISLSQELWVTEMTLGATLAIIAIAFLFPNWRRRLMRIFRPE